MSSLLQVNQASAIVHVFNRFSNSLPTFLVTLACVLTFRSVRGSLYKGFKKDSGEDMPQLGVWEFVVHFLWRRLRRPQCVNWVLPRWRLLGDIWRHPFGVVVTSPELAKYILMSHWPRPKQMLFGSLNVLQMLPSQRPRFAHQSPVSAARHQDVLGKRYAEAFRLATVLLLHRWSAQCEQAERSIIGIEECIQRFTLDAIGIAALGRTFTAVVHESEGICPYLVALAEWLRLSADHSLPLFYFFAGENHRSLWLLNLEKSLRIYFRVACLAFSKLSLATFADDREKTRQNMEKFSLLSEWMTKILQEKRMRRGSVEAPDLMDQMIAGEVEHTTVSDETLRKQLLSLLHVGQNAPARVLEIVLKLLAIHPDVQARARDEVTRVAGSGNISVEMLGKLVYLQAVLKETLRMHPSVVSSILRVCPDDEVLGGYHIPKGTIVEISTYAVHHHPAHWEESDAFKPERFLSSCDTAVWIPFGAGQYQCTGIGFAWTELLLSLASILLYFSWTEPDQGVTTSGGGVHLALHLLDPEKVRLKKLFQPVDDTAPSEQQAKPNAFQPQHEVELGIEWDSAMMVHGPLALSWSYLGNCLEARVVCRHWLYGCDTAGRVAPRRDTKGRERRSLTRYSVRTRDGMVKSTPRNGRASRISMWLTIIGIVLAMADIIRSGAPCRSVLHMVLLYCCIIVLSSYCSMRLSKEGVLQMLERKHWIVDGAGHWVVMIVIVGVLFLGSLVLPTKHILVMCCPAGRLLPLFLFIIGCFVSGAVARYDFHRFVEGRTGQSIKVSEIRLPPGEALPCPVCTDANQRSLSICRSSTRD